jgi:acyl dehydratase
MPIDYDTLMAFSPPATEQSFTQRDTMLYALGVGLGSDPMDTAQLRFVYEQDLVALPTMACVLGYSPIRELGLGINYAKALHGDQTTILHRPLPVQGTVVSKLSVRDVVDRGEKGAIIYIDRAVSDKDSGALLANVQMGVFCRADGGFGGPARPTPALHEIPSRPADAMCSLPTLPQAALLYRLSGDYNPLHADPDVAKKAGFDRPILHGLATYGVIGHAVLKLACHYDASRLLSLAGRFSSPVYPGETIKTEIWQDGETVSFRASVAERGVVVMNNGRATVRAN